ncbi:hypothetical protein MCOR27_000924 [Pyricularia oryzae]|nr:hypothetical protein MCOR01_008051 [Pyricularia oryzae]KAI6284020.1 hypothetical protein MCOR26_002147 [Pyricularia oryzae]KAI6288608.1 hypothetical protein MCOR27_000924 [Pyricularia oryzae]KAI6322455.1 hypothetical protein MCOR29_004736 [Pyricularia oryzae]KAI6326816.1 hypothetical protein MCOR30_006430 [Pyricularia oryzae]
MDGLDDFEKQLAADKAEREREQERAERKEKRRHHHRRDRSSDRTGDRERHRDHDRDSDRHRHKHRRHDSRERERDRDEDGHRHKRSRKDEDENDRDKDSSRRRHRHRHGSPSRRNGREVNESGEPSYIQAHDPKEDLPLPDEETPSAEAAARPVRDSWMTAPSAFDVDYVHRPQKDKGPAKKEPEQRVISERELNSGVLAAMNSGKAFEDLQVPTQTEVSYKFGDEGSQWRMTKLKGVYDTAKRTGRSVDEIGAETFGSIREFDDAREERIEMDRRRTYGSGYKGKEVPTGELYKERNIDDSRPSEVQDDVESPPEQGIVVDDPPAARIDQTTLNRMRAAMMKAKLRRAPDAEKLEAEYNAAMASFSSGMSNDRAVVLDASHSRMLAAGGQRAETKALDTKRGRERGTLVANDDMTIDDMVREEKRTRGQAGGDGMKMAERIARDGKFDNDLEYMEENAERLAKRTHKSDAALKALAVGEFQRMNKILDSCPLCHHEDREPPRNLPIAPVISLATRVYMTLAPGPELNNGAEGGAVLVPLSHRQNLLECDDDEWEEMRNFMKSLTRLYHDQGREVLFYENAAAPNRRGHAHMVAVPIPYEQGDTAPAFFKEAMLTVGEEWSQHKKYVDTAKKAREGLGKLAFRRSIAKEAPYFHVWFNLDGGLGHVVEDESSWPRGDQFAREIIGGMLDSDMDLIKKQPRWSRSDSRADDFKKRWRKFDWTRVLTEGQ